MFGDRGGQRQFFQDGALTDPEVGQCAALRIAFAASVRI